MIKTEFMQKLLNADDECLRKMDIEQLRVALGVFRFFIRRLEREINTRTFR